MRRAGWLERDLVGDTSEHECETQLWLVSAAKTALRSRRLLLVAGLMASAIPWLTGNAAMFLAIPAAYVARFAVALFDGRARQSVRRLARQLPIELPSATDFWDGGARRLIERLACARRATERAVLAGPVGVAFDVSNLVERVPQLERDVVVLVARVEYLKRSLDSSPPAELLANGARFEKEHGGLEGTVPVSDQVDQVIGPCPEHLDLLARLTNRRNEACEMAEKVLRTLEQIPAKIVNLQLTRIESCDSRSVDACKEAATLMETFGALERAISELPSEGTSLHWPPANVAEEVDCFDARPGEHLAARMLPGS